MNTPPPLVHLEKELFSDKLQDTLNKQGSEYYLVTSIFRATEFALRLSESNKSTVNVELKFSDIFPSDFLRHATTRTKTIRFKDVTFAFQALLIKNT